MPRREKPGSSSSASSAGPFGELKGMRWDSEKGRYYKVTAVTPGFVKAGSSQTNRLQYDGSSLSTSSRGAHNDTPSKRRRMVTSGEAEHGETQDRSLGRNRRRHGQEARESHAGHPRSSAITSDSFQAGRMASTNHLVSLGLSPRARPRRTREEIRAASSRPSSAASAAFGIQLSREEIQRSVWGSLMRQSHAGEEMEAQQVFPAPLSCMSTAPGHKNAVIVGDVRGSIIAASHCYAPLGPRNDPANQWADTRMTWHDISLGSKIVGIRCWNDAYTALSFGPRPRLVVAPLPAMLELAPGLTPRQRDPDSATLLWDLPEVKDAWCMDISPATDQQGASLYHRASDSARVIAIGGSRQVVHFDLADQRWQRCRLRSDALSVRCLGGSGQEVIAGLRSSEIVHLDFRQSMTKAAAVRGELGRGKSVVGLEVLEGELGGGRGVLAAGFGNKLVYIDTRFMRAEPVTRFAGHVNDFRSGLGLTLDPTQSIVFAAGSDHRVRAWSLRTGAALESSLAAGESGLFDNVFDAPVSGLGCWADGVLNVLNDRKMEVYAVNRDLLL